LQLQYINSNACFFLKSNFFIICLERWLTYTTLHDEGSLCPVGTETNATFLLVNQMNHSNVRPCVSALKLVNCIIDCLLSRLDDTSLYCFLNPAPIVPPSACYIWRFFMNIYSSSVGGVDCIMNHNPLWDGGIRCHRASLFFRFL
jgi:hypothetical protein